MTQQVDAQAVIQKLLNEISRLNVELAVKSVALDMANAGAVTVDEEGSA